MFDLVSVSIDVGIAQNDDVEKTVGNSLVKGSAVNCGVSVQLVKAIELFVKISIVVSVYLSVFVFCLRAIDQRRGMRIFVKRVDKGLIIVEPDRFADSLRRCVGGVQKQARLVNPQFIAFLKDGHSEGLAEQPFQIGMAHLYGIAQLRNRKISVQIHVYIGERLFDINIADAVACAVTAAYQFRPKSGYQQCPR